jgi:hypothetical protein
MKEVKKKDEQLAKLEEKGNHQQSDDTKGSWRQNLIQNPKTKQSDSIVDDVTVYDCVEEIRQKDKRMDALTKERKEME